MEGGRLDRIEMAEGGAGSMLAWVEKYRPRTVGEIAHQDAVVSTLQKV